MQNCTKTCIQLKNKKRREADETMCKYGGSNKRRYNAPTSNEIAAFFFVFFLENGGLPEIDTLLRIPETLLLKKYLIRHVTRTLWANPILFTHGEFRSHCEMRHMEESKSSVRKRLTKQKYYSYLLAFTGGFSFIHSARKLFQLSVVDTYVKVQCCILKYLRKNQV